MEPRTKTVKDTNQSLLDESKATTKNLWWNKKTFHMITPKSTTDPQSNLSVTSTRAEKNYDLKIEKEIRSRSNWWFIR